MQYSRPRLYAHKVASSHTKSPLTYPSSSHFLGVEMEDIEIKVSGNFDVVIAGSHHQDITTTRQHMWGGLELKKRDNTTKPAEILRQVVLYSIWQLRI
jgi:hypothetical protein